MRTLVMVFQAAACCLAMDACGQSGSRRAYPPPPSGSYRTASTTLTAGGASHSIRAAFVTPEFVKAAREQPLVGRSFVVEEHQAKGQPVVILSHGLWRQRFGADPSVIGKSVALDGRAHTIVGIMPKGFDVPAGAEAWLPEAAPGR